MTHALAVSLARRAKVNSISTGWIDTAYTIYDGPDAIQQPVGHVDNPMDIVNMVLFLCSDKSGFITGENICIDGGMTKDDLSWRLRVEVGKVVRLPAKSHATTSSAVAILTVKTGIYSEDSYYYIAKIANFVVENLHSICRLYYP